MTTRRERRAIGARVGRRRGRTCRAAWGCCVGPPRTMSAAVWPPPHLGAALAAGAVGGGVLGAAAAAAARSPHAFPGADATGAATGAGPRGGAAVWPPPPGFDPPFGAGRTGLLTPLCCCSLPPETGAGWGGRGGARGGGGQRGGAFRRRRDGADSSDARARTRARTRAPGSARESAPVLPSRFCSRLSPARFSRPFDLPSRARGLGASCDGRGGGGRVSGARRDGGEDRSLPRERPRGTAVMSRRGRRRSSSDPRTSFFFFPPLTTTSNFSTAKSGRARGRGAGVRGRRAARRGPGCDRVFFFSPANRFPEKALGEDRETERRGRARDGARTVHQRVRRGVHVPAVLFQHRHHVLLRLARDRRQRFHLVSPLHRSRHKKMTPSTASSETRALALSRSVTLLERPTWCISRLDARAISRRRESKRSTGERAGADDLAGSRRRK